MVALALFTSCKERHYTPPSLNAVRAGENARKQWADAKRDSPQKLIPTKRNELLPDSSLTQDSIGVKNDSISISKNNSNEEQQIP